MLIKTHLAVTVFFILLFISNVENQITFAVVALLATFFADIDSQFSILGRYKIFRFFQFFVKHRTIIHTFLFLFLVTFFFVLFFPILALPFFLGYASHLMVDSFTVMGIKPFWPLKKVSSGIIRTGNKSETIVFVVFVLIDIFLIFSKIFSIL